MKRWDDCCVYHPVLANLPARVGPYLAPVNYITIHYTYFTLVALVFSIISWAGSSQGNEIDFVDSLFFATSATTGAGLNPVNVSDLSTGQQAVLLILMILGSPPTFDRLESPSLGPNRARLARNPGLEGRSTPRPRNRLRSTTCLRSNPEISKLVAMLHFHCLSWISRPRAPVLEVFPSLNRLNGPLALSLLYLVRLELVFNINVFLQDNRKNISNSTLEALPVGQRVFDGFFQAVSLFSAGFALISPSALYSDLQVLWLILMYVSAYPMTITMRNSNVYEERDEEVRQSLSHGRTLKLRPKRCSLP